MIADLKKLMEQLIADQKEIKVQIMADQKDIKMAIDKFQKDLKKDIDAIKSLNVLEMVTLQETRKQIGDLGYSKVNNKRFKARQSRPFLEIHKNHMGKSLLI